ncbi:MAG: TetR/AcrR family transcriptional regulator [Flammeovirgaceae bacterium]
MGRKAIERKRKPLTEKVKAWVRELVLMIQDKPIHALTLDELAELIGKSKSTIYTYFSTKEEIYQTGVQLILESIKEVISPKAIEGDDMELVLRAMLFKISEGIAGISIRFLEQLKIHFPRIWQVIEMFTDKLLANLERIYQKGMQTGVFKPFNISLLTALDRHFVMSIMTNATQFSHQGMSFNDLVTEYLELRLSALRQSR